MKDSHITDSMRSEVDNFKCGNSGYSIDDMPELEMMYDVLVVISKARVDFCVGV
jgi:hypothetical protein